jgi:hypothetical protein
VELRNVISNHFRDPWFATNRSPNRPITQDSRRSAAASTNTTISATIQESATMLCGRCQALCSSIDPHKDNDFLHHETVEELRTNANSGCLLCKIIHRDLVEKLDGPISISSKVTIKTRRDIGFEASFVDSVPDLSGGPRNDGKSPVVYVVFESFRLPRKF